MTRKKKRAKRIRLNAWVNPATGERRVYINGSTRNKSRPFAFATERGGFNVSSRDGSDQDVAAALTTLAALGVGSATPFSQLLKLATAGRAPARKKPAKQERPERLDDWQQQHMASIRNEILKG